MHKRLPQFLPPKRPAKSRRTAKKKTHFQNTVKIANQWERWSALVSDTSWGSTYRNQHALRFLERTATAQKCDDQCKCGSTDKHTQSDVWIVFMLHKLCGDRWICQCPSNQYECHNARRLWKQRKPILQLINVCDTARRVTHTRTSKSWFHYICSLRISSSIVIIAARSGRPAATHGTTCLNSFDFRYHLRAYTQWQYVQYCCLM